MVSLLNTVPASEAAARRQEYIERAMNLVQRAADQGFCCPAVDPRFDPAFAYTNHAGARQHHQFEK
jgi:hypothetical protein